MSNIDLYNGNHDYNEDSPCTDDLKRNDSYIDLLGKSQGYIISLYGYESDKLFVDYFSQGSNILIKDKVKEYIKLFKHKAEINDENFRICISRLLISSIYPRQEETFNINMLKNYYYIAAMGVKERTILRT